MSAGFSACPINAPINSSRNRRYALSLVLPAARRRCGRVPRGSTLATSRALTDSVSSGLLEAHDAAVVDRLDDHDRFEQCPPLGELAVEVQSGASFVTGEVSGVGTPRAEPIGVGAVLADVVHDRRQAAFPAPRAGRVLRRLRGLGIVSEAGSRQYLRCGGLGLSVGHGAMFPAGSTPSMPGGSHDQDLDALRTRWVVGEDRRQPFGPRPAGRPHAAGRVVADAVVSTPGENCAGSPGENCAF